MLAPLVCVAQMSYNLIVALRRYDMTQNAFVRARISENIKNQATEVLAGLGLTVSDACRIMLTRVANEKQLPFALNTPNAETAQAIDELASGQGVRYASAEAMFKDLGLK
jgi:DNA-damage-inducible protein J